MVEDDAVYIWKLIWASRGRGPSLFIWLDLEKCVAP